MNEKEFLKELIKRGHCAQDGYFQFVHIVACLLDRRLHEQLRQLVFGPTYDGDVVSKSDRDELIHLGLAMRVCRAGEQGHTGATYFAYSVLKVVEQIKAGQIGA